MKSLIYLIALGITCLSSLCEGKTGIIAHRGYWNTSSVAQNSLESLKMAQHAKCWGSEFDVYVSTDGIPIVNHDRTITKDKLVVENCDSKTLLNLILRNGETIPTFESYIKEGKKVKGTKLIPELEGHSSAEKDEKMVRACVDIVKKEKMEDRVEYISFSLRVLKKLLEINPKAKCYYLSGNLSPKEAKEAGFYGIDYHLDVFKKNPQWIKEAHDLGLKVNVWTVNKRNDLQFFIEHGVDYITTDEPVFAQRLVDEWEKNKSFSTKDPEKSDL